MMSYRENLQKCHEYVRALEEERRKIQMFQRELPLCLEIVTQTIESCKQQLPGTTAATTTTTSTECSEQTTSEGVVFEEFIPIKSCHVGDVGEEVREEDNKEVEYSQKSDWLRSAQLWNQSPDPPTNEEKEDDSSLQVSGIEVKSVEAVAPPAAATKEGLTRKSRRCWSPELHRRFLSALQQLGGPHVGTPKQIREVMKVDGLTNDEVKSHLQKYRLHSCRRERSCSNSTSTEAAPQFVVVGGIWVPPVTGGVAQQQPQPRQETDNKGARCNSPAMSSSSSARAATAPPATCT